MTAMNHREIVNMLDAHRPPFPGADRWSREEPVVTKNISERKVTVTFRHAFFHGKGIDIAGGSDTRLKHRRYRQWIHESGQRRGRRFMRSVSLSRRAIPQA